MSRSSTSACLLHTDEGLQAAKRIRERWPETGILVLSQFVQARYAVELLANGTEGVGYLLKDRVSNLEELTTAVRRIGEEARCSILRRRAARRPAAQGDDPLET